MFLEDGFVRESREIIPVREGVPRVGLFLAVPIVTTDTREYTCDSCDHNAELEAENRESHV